MKGKMDWKDSFTIEKLSGEQLISIYTEVAVRHFPEDELKPVSMIRRLLSEGSYEGLGLICSEKLAGYAFFVHVPGKDTLLLDYYAILEEYREAGTGSRFLQKMRESFADYSAILIETEEPGEAKAEEERLLRLRRNAFYLRNGCRQTAVRSSLFGVAFGIFVLPVKDGVPVKDTLADGQIYERLEEIYRYVFAGDAFDKYVRME